MPVKIAWAKRSLDQTWALSTKIDGLGLDKVQMDWGIELSNHFEALGCF
jgi:hypothetical protein